MTENVTYTGVLECVKCYSCGVPFGIESHLHAELLKNRTRDFFCTNGHSQHYLGESDAEKFKRLWSAAEIRKVELIADRDRIERRRRALKGIVTRTKRRVGNGVCPCCTRSFSNLRRHMDTKHPDYKKLGTEERKR